VTLERIRLADVEDVANLAPLFDAYRQFYEMAPDLARAQDYLAARLGSGESTVLLAEDGRGDTVGFAQMYFSFCSVFTARICTLYDLFVVPEARGQGIGEALLKAAERQAAQGGAVRISLQTAITNRAAQALYEKAGWMRNSTFHHYSKRLG
jgi:ribosomal protein S18 acetylase RimI-like enzyme